MIPSRATWYEFRDRLVEFWDSWNEQVLRKAEELGIPVGERVALDGSLIAALASRHRLLNQKTLTSRTEQLEKAVAVDRNGAEPEDPPGWMAKHPETREDQLARYQQAQTRMDELQAENAKRKSSKRKKPEKVVVSVSEPGAVLGRDKLKVFRPLYNLQLMHDIDWGFISAYQTFAQQNDPGTIGPMLERSVELTGKKPGIILADAAYAGGPDLEVCKQAGVTLYAPVNENDFSEAKGKKRKVVQIPKKDFQWLPQEQTYRCPEGHLLVRGRTKVLERSSERTVQETTYRCAGEHCETCPRGNACTPVPAKGRSVSRLEYEDLVDELRARMQTPEAKGLYKLRRQTIELRYADLKEHRQFRRFSGYGLCHARAETAASVLAYNLLVLMKAIKSSLGQPAELVQIPEEVPS
jgi:Transposase DDE domain